MSPIPTWEPPDDVGRIVELNAAPCVLDESGAMHCWDRPGEQRPTFLPGPYIDLAGFRGAEGGAWIAALRADGNPEPIYCLSSSSNGCASVDGPLAGMPGYRNGVRPDGSIVDHNNLFEGGEWRIWTVEGEMLVALSQDGWLRHYRWSLQGPADVFIEDHERVTQVAAAGSAACLLDESGEIRCVGDEEIVMPGQYVELRGSTYGACALRQDRLGIDCSDGRVIESDVEIRLISVGDITFELAVCWVTEEEEVGCDHPLPYYYAGFEGVPL